MMLKALLGQGFTAERAGKPASFWCRIRFIALIAAAVLAAPRADLAAAEDLGARMLTLVNAARAAEGQGPLRAEPRLAAAACRHGRDLARGRPLSHRGTDGGDLGDRLTRSGYDFAMAAENLAAGMATPEETVRRWLASPGHRRNILTGAFRQAGIAHLPGAGGDIWVLVLAAPLASAETGQAAAPSGRRADNLEDDNRITCY